MRKIACPPMPLAALPFGPSFLLLPSLPFNFHFLDFYCEIIHSNPHILLLLHLFYALIPHSCHDDPIQWPIDAKQKSFFDSVARFTPDFIPSKQDIVRVRIRTTGIDEAPLNWESFNFSYVSHQLITLQRWSLKPRKQETKNVFPAWNSAHFFSITPSHACLISETNLTVSSIPIQIMQIGRRRRPKN